MKTLSIFLTLAVTAAAVNPEAEEKAFLEKVTQLLRAGNARKGAVLSGPELRKLVCWEGVSAEAKESFDLEVGKAAGEADWHVEFASARLEPLRFPAHEVRPPEANLVRTKTLVLVFDGVAGGKTVLRWTVGWKDGRLMIGVPLKPQTAVK